MKRWFAVAAVVYLLLVVTRAAEAATVLPLSFDQMVAQSATIVRAEVVNVSSRWRDSSGGSPIVTRVELRVVDALKGNPGARLELELIGGTVGDLTLEISDMPRFVVGEQAFLFLAAGRSISPIVGFSAGRWPIRRDAFTGRDYVTTASGLAMSNPSAVNGRAATLSGLQPLGAVALSPDEAAAAIRRQIAVSR